MNENGNIWFLLLGALLATLGGIAGDELRAWSERRRKRGAIKISLADELNEIETT